MPNNRSEWVPRDLRGIRDPFELRMRYNQAHSDYVAHLRGKVTNIEQELNELSSTSIEERNILVDELAKTKDQLFFVENSDPLFTYSNEARMLDAVTANGVRVSGGADNLFLHQRGYFPRGGYGTTISPWEQENDRAAMRLNFFDYEYSLPSATYSGEATASFEGPLQRWQNWDLARRPELPTENFVAFAQDSNWAPRGRLDYPESRMGYSDPFYHYSRDVGSDETFSLNGSEYVQQDIIGYGETLIPDSHLEAALLRSPSEPSFAPLREAGTMEPVSEGRIIRRFSTGDTILLM